MSGTQIVMDWERKYLAKYPFKGGRSQNEAVCCAAVRGTTMRGTYDRPIATGTILTTATTTVFELPMLQLAWWYRHCQSLTLPGESESVCWSPGLPPAMGSEICLGPNTKPARLLQVAKAKTVAGQLFLSFNYIQTALNPLSHKINLE